MLEVERVTTRRHWAAVLNQMGAYDFCHSYDFHRISSQSVEGDPIMFACSRQGMPRVVTYFAGQPPSVRSRKHSGAT